MRGGGLGVGESSRSVNELQAFLTGLPQSVTVRVTVAESLESPGALGKAM
jgi:hypothetical protein